MVKNRIFYLVDRDFGTAVACIRRLESIPLMNCVERWCQNLTDATSLDESFVDWLVLKNRISKLVCSEKNANQRRHADNEFANGNLRAGCNAEIKSNGCKFSVGELTIC